MCLDWNGIGTERAGCDSKPIHAAILMNLQAETGHDDYYTHHDNNLVAELFTAAQ